jgi:hypothetical protein
MSEIPPEQSARLRPAIRRVVDALALDVRPLAASSVQPDRFDAEETSVIGPISNSQGRSTEMRMNEIQQLIDRGEYRVDTHAVADAILRRILAGQGRPETPRTADQS